MYNIREYQYTHISSSGAATTVCFVGRGNLGGVGVNTATAVGLVTVKDAAVATGGTTVGIIAAAAPAGNYMDGVSISAGLVIVTAGASDLTVKWTQG